MLNYNRLGYYRVSAHAPKIFLGNPEENVKEIIRLAKISASDNAIVSLFPELSITGYTCEDLFLGDNLLERVDSSLKHLVNESKDINSIIIVGSPIKGNTGVLYNGAVVIFKGKILGIVPKTFIPNYGEFYEKRWFTSGYNVTESISICGQLVRLSTNQIFKIKDLNIGVEICEDVWAPIPPSSALALKGANLIVNLSASNDLVAKADYRKELISQQSGRLNCSYLYSSSGAFESSKDLVFGGHLICAENGSIVKESERFSLESTSIFHDVDVNKLAFERRRNGTFSDNAKMIPDHFSFIQIQEDVNLPDLKRVYSKTPFIPNNKNELTKRVNEILDIQSTGLARRMKSVGTNKLVLGLSGGLDSTLALIVAERAFKKLNIEMDNLHCITMPGFGTSDQTKDLATRLGKAFNVTFKEVSIIKAVEQHFEDIGHNKEDYSVTFENAQARERTQILFDYSNKIGGIVLGTGDLSELALGWATFNGDHMSGYNVNGSIPKTLVKFIINEYATSQNDEIKAILGEILGLVISPELLPLKDGKIQSTEDKIGPYFLHDFFLFHLIRGGFSQDKILEIAKLTFKDDYTVEIIEKWHKEFFLRFFKNQFKRTTLPPGPKVGSVSLSPRGDWRCPDEA